MEGIDLLLVFLPSTDPSWKIRFGARNENTGA
jgi:hypothetical protein